MITYLIKTLKAAGGRPFLIGGAVVDSLQGREIKDWDIEVFNLSLQDIEQTLTRAGFRVDAVGKSFGILKTQVNDLEIDISVPRRENKIGVGHTGFEVECDPNMTPKEAARRRDLTINSMYQNLETGEIIDPFNGLPDLERGILRATNEKTFREDPLRVLRIMQLLPRKGKKVAKETMELCQSMVEEFSELKAERVFAEFNKLLLKTDKPSLGLQFLADSGWVKHFPALANLIGCEQNKEWHPEGDVFEHTKRVIDIAAILKQDLPEDWHLPFMYGALLHDAGKPSTTLEDLTAHGHASAGVPVAGLFMCKLTTNVELINRVMAIVANHMDTGQLARDPNVKGAAWRRLHNRLRLDVCAAMSEADAFSRDTGDIEISSLPAEKAIEWFKKLGEKPIPKVLMGRHLIEKGLTPGPEFGKILARAYEIQIEEDLKDIDELFDRAMEGK
jgi:tRNA nucleotidyltransferase (CCA-adding enzyme)